MLNQFVASYGDVGSPFQISNPGENYSYYDPKSGSISIYSNLINSIHDDYGQYKAVIVLAHEVSHALSDIKPDASSVYTYARSRNLDEGEAIYHEFLALYNIYPEIKEYRRDLWRDNESDFTLNPDNNIYDEVKRIVLGSASEQEKISQCAKINTEILWGELGSSSVEFTYDEFYKWYWLDDHTYIANDYMEAWGKPYIRDSDGKFNARNEIEASIISSYDIKTLVNQAHDYFGTDGSDTLHVETKGSALGSIRGYEILWGGKGSDYLYGADSTKDILLGGDDDDYLYGYGSDDILAGNIGNDHLYGGAGTDYLYGGEGVDTLEDGGDEVNYLNFNFFYYLLQGDFVVGGDFFTNQAQGVAICNGGIVIIFVDIVTKQGAGVVLLTQQRCAC